MPRRQYIRNGDEQREYRHFWQPTDPEIRVVEQWYLREYRRDCKLREQRVQEEVRLDQQWWSRSSHEKAPAPHLLHGKKSMNLGELRRALRREREILEWRAVFFPELVRYLKDKLYPKVRISDLPLPEELNL